MIYSIPHYPHLQINSIFKKKTSLHAILYSQCVSVIMPSIGFPCHSHHIQNINRQYLPSICRQNILISKSEKCKPRLDGLKKQYDEDLQWLTCIYLFKFFQWVQFRLESHYIMISTDFIIDVPRPLTNDLWVFLFQTIDAECIKWGSPAGPYVYVKAFIVNVNICLKPFFSRATYQYCKQSHASKRLVYLYC